MIDPIEHLDQVLDQPMTWRHFIYMSLVVLVITFWRVVIKVFRSAWVHAAWNKAKHHISKIGKKKGD